MGVFKKVVIADRLTLFTDPVFNNVHKYHPLVLLLAIIFFSFQIFCDFSGYSDIALGSARVMGFKLMTNFNKPYHARSISEFWKRWHISLSSWFKDYLYISLGGNRVSIPRWYFNLFFVFLVSGFWHGANWTFILWGALHGSYLIWSIITAKPGKYLAKLTGIDKVFWLHNFLKLVSTYLLVTFAWIFFRSNTVYDALFIIRNLPSAISALFDVLLHKTSLPDIPVTRITLLLSLSLIGFLELIHILQAKNITYNFRSQPIWLRWSVYYAFLFAILFLGVFENRQFIYFQF